MPHTYIDRQTDDTRYSQRKDKQTEKKLTDRHSDRQQTAGV